MEFENDLLIRVIKYGLNKPDGFNSEVVLNDKELDLKPTETEILKTYFRHAFRNAHSTVSTGHPNLESLFLLSEATGSNCYHENCRYVINLDSKFKYIDYLELKHAREASQNALKASQRAHELSIKAIKIALFGIIFTTVVTVAVAIVIAVFSTQTVELDSGQYKILEEKLNTLVNKE
ncbi:MAG: hypothetical protein ABIH87_03735 [bacterium]